MSKSGKSNLVRGGLSIASLLGAGLLAAPQMASAQPAAPAAPAAASANDDNVVIITAQKRPENLQDVPVVVSAFGAQKLQDAGIHDIKELATITPGMTVTSTGSAGSTTARIRGIGTVSDNPGLEAQVAVEIDGVNRPRNGVAFSDLGELQDIEIIKGPQGTLFGKNTTAGVLSIHTKRPSFNYGVNIEGTAGNFGGYGAAASVTGPLMSDKIAGRLYIADRQRDGFYSVAGPTGSGVVKMNDQDMFTTRDQLLFQPNSNFDINIIGDYTMRNEHCCAGVPIFLGPTAGAVNAEATALPGGSALPSTPNPQAYQAFYNQKNTEQVRDGGLSVEANWKFDGATLTSITSGRQWKDSAPDGADVDYSDADIIRTAHGGFTRFKDYSEELRLSGNTDNLQWLGGIFLAKEDIDVASSLLFGSQYGAYINLLSASVSPAGQFPAFLGRHDTYAQTGNTQALFTQETYKFNDQVDLTAGVRYTRDSKSLASHYTNDAGADAGCLTGRGLGTPFNGSTTAAVLDCYLASNFFNNFSQQQSEKESAVTGTVKLSYRPWTDFMTYASYSRGFLAGGFNFDRVLLPASPLAANSFTPNPTSNGGTLFNPTYVNAYEIGEKWRLLDGKMTLNGAIFYQNYRDFQLNTFNGVNFFVTSIPEVRSQGVELDTTYALSPDFKLNGGVTYADTFYPNTARNTASLLANSLPNLPGHQLPLAPLWSVTAGGLWQHSITDDFKLRLSLDAKYQSTTNTGSDLDPHKVQSAFTLVNGRVGLGPQSGRWNVELFGTNIFNTYYQQVAFAGPFQSGTFYAFNGLPRTYGVSLRAKF